MAIELDLIKQLIGLMNENHLQELEVEEEGRKIRLCKAGEKTVQGIVPPTPIALAVSPAPVAAVLPPAAPAGDGTAAPAPKVRREGLKEVTSPLVGTFYRSPAPDADPYVEVGDKVGEDSVICIIEAMKVMNEIKAECSGVVAEILVANGEAVEYGQPLFLVRLE